MSRRNYFGKTISRSLVGSPNNSIYSFGGKSNRTPENASSISTSSRSGSLECLDLDEKLRKVLSDAGEEDGNINVVVRVRPLSEKEKRVRDPSIVQLLPDGQIMIENFGNKPKIFSYNTVFEPTATQEDVLQYSGVKRLIEMAIEGFRCTIFCYGQTGSGKTHTLTGPPKLFKKLSPYSEHHGLIFRAFLHIFEEIQKRNNFNFILKASFLEIYNEKVIDLLNPAIRRKPLAVRWSKKNRGFFVENLFMVDCEELDDLIGVLEEGIRNRSMGYHNMNDFSSRSHTILTVYITSEQPAEGGVFISRSGKINFVDLAGSEMTKKTQSAGKTLEEANNINKSLMVLGYCISTLSDTKKKNNYIPYRDSKLTKLLADSLAGNGVTLMIACISPARSNLNETLNTLRYASRAKKIKLKPVVMMDPREALILSLKQTVENLELENEHLRNALSTVPLSDFTLISKDVNSNVPKLNVDDIVHMDNKELIQLVQVYAEENENLKNDNAQLFYLKDQMLRDQELLSRENEKLVRNLEEAQRVTVRSPNIAVRPVMSANDLLTLNDDEYSLAFKNRDIWTNPEEMKKDNNELLPPAVEKELNKRRIEIPKLKLNSKSSESSGSVSSLPEISLKRLQQKNPDLFGSYINN
ncbi:kinesin-like protein KIF12 [Onthophagus taurus]|uniref:kinesin-like protein KIF12 n=1 Tax=Onthophagus taurus TaxID=166361 RepID=UPI0039BE2A49